MENGNYVDKLAYVAAGNIDAEAYWLSKLSGIEKSCFPFDRHEDRERAREKSALSFFLPPELFSRVMTVCGRSDPKLYMFLTTLLNILLYKYTGSEDIIIGTSIFKQEVEMEFINTILPLRNRVQDDMTFKDLLFRVRETIIEAEEHQAFLIDLILQELGMTVVPDDDFPLFDIIILLTNIQDRKYINSVKTNMLISFSRGDDQLQGTIEYDTSLYEKTTIRRIIDHMLRLFEIVLNDADTGISGIDISTADERERLLVKFNDTNVEYPRHKTVYQLFEEQVERTPGNTAVESGDLKLSYRELDKMSNRLAGILKKNGTGSKTITGLMLNRSIEMLAGILGILKAGGAYLPVDPDYPEERMNIMLNDSGTGMLLTTSTVRSRDRFRGEIICLDEIDLFNGDDSNSEIETGINDPVYIIYTSGTTGNPKGVVIEHMGLTNYIWWAAKHYVKGENADFPLYTTLSFDLTVTSIFTPIITGNAVVIYQGEKNDFLLEKVIEENKVAVIKTTPAHLKLIKEIGIGNNSAIKRLIVGGEKLETGLAKEIYDHFHGKVELFNEYGPTETVVGCMIYKFDPGKNRGTSLPIGKPGDNVNIYLLDGNLRLVPPGAPGEIYISGDGVCQGYINHQELTGARLSNDPFCPGSRMYRTGDLARFLPDGNVEFLDRADRQVKIRGYRIELAEIERQLVKHDKVKDAVVTVNEDESGDRFTCAYITGLDSKPDACGTEPGNDLSFAKEFREFLSRSLPDYMAPRYFVPVEKIPLTANGKIDEKSLPDPSLADREAYAPPAGHIQEKLAGIWSEVLGIDKDAVSINSNFFDSGGHSLKATILAARTRKELGVKLSIEEIFKKPTIRGLSEFVKDAALDEYFMISPVEEKEYYPVTSDQKRIYMMNMLGDEKSPFFISFKRPFYRRLDKKQLTGIFEALIKRHEIFRTSFTLVGEELVQIIHEEFDFHVTYSDVAGNELNHLIRDFNRPFDLENVPLLRVMVISLSKERHILVCDMPHMISDGSSLEILIKEFEYLAQDRQLPGLKIKFRDFAEWQNKLIKLKDMNKQEKYWLDVFKGEIPVLDMPADFPRPPIQSFAGAHLKHVIEAGLSRKLNRLVKDTETTLFMALSAILFVLLYKYSGQTDIIIGTTSAGRNYPGLGNVIGMLMRTLTIRGFPEDNKMFSDFLAEIKTSTLAVFDNQDYPFQELLDKVRGENDLSRNPLFDVMLLVQNMEERRNVQAGIDTSGVNPAELGVDKKEMNADDVNTGDLGHFELPVDIQIDVWEREEKIIFFFEYCIDLFKKETMERFSNYFIEIIRIVVENPDIKLGDIDILHDYGAAGLDMISRDETEFGF